VPRLPLAKTGDPREVCAPESIDPPLCRSKAVRSTVRKTETAETPRRQEIKLILGVLAAPRLRYWNDTWQVQPVPPVHAVPVAVVHGMLLQHCALVVHCWP
jgi:hypothetical protein